MNQYDEQRKEEAEKLLKRRLEAGVITVTDYKTRLRELNEKEVVYTKTNIGSGISARGRS